MPAAESPAILDAPPPFRLASLDVFRGFVIAAMILVPDPGSKYSYQQLRHSEWMGTTFTDMIAPGFLFMVGVAIPFSFASRAEQGASRATLVLRILRRSVALFVVGIALNELPEFHWHTLHITGILQLVARCYFCGALLYLLLLRARVSTRVVVLTAVGVASLAIYWALLKLVPVPGIGAGHLDMYGSLPAYLDRTIVGVNHMGRYGIVKGHGVSFDPNGLLLTLPATFSTFVGILTGMLLRGPRSDRAKLLGMLVAGAAFALVGVALRPLLPFIKNIWTSTYALFSTGVSVLTFALAYFVVDMRRLRHCLTPLFVLGTNAILAFALSTIITRLLSNHFMVNGVKTSARQWLNDHLFATWLPPYPASLTYAIFIVALNILLIYPLYRKRVFLKL